MLSHVHIGTSDLERAMAFYAPLMEALGYPLKFHEPAHGWAGWMPRDAPRPLFIVGRPYNGEPAEPGNGGMAALLASSRAIVDRCHALAIAGGARCEGPPGPRPHYHARYYGAYFRDLDRNKLCLCCHGPEPG